jgi:hypothetical protein
MELCWSAIDLRGMLALLSFALVGGMVVWSTLR